MRRFIYQKRRQHIWFILLWIAFFVLLSPKINAQIIPRWYVNELDEHYASQEGWMYSSLNGLEWHVNRFGDNPLGYSQSLREIDGLYFWSENDGVWHPKAFAHSLSVASLPDSLMQAKKIRLIADLNFGNESGDPGIWASTSKITPNSDRKGPDLNLLLRLNNPSSSLSLFGHYMSYALDDIHQIKRLKTIQDGNALSGLRMPLIQSTGAGGYFKFDQKAINGSIFLAYNNADRFVFDRMLAFERPQNHRRMQLSTNFSWLSNDAKAKVEFRQSVFQQNIRANKNAVQFESNKDQQYNLQELSFRYTLVEPIDLGLTLFREDRTLSNRLNNRSIFSQFWEIRPNASVRIGKQVFSGSFSRIGNQFFNLALTAYDIKWEGRLISNWSAAIELKKEQIPTFRTDPFLYEESQLLNDRSMIDASDFALSTQNRLLQTPLSINDFYASHLIKISVLQKKWGKMSFFGRRWDSIPVMYSQIKADSLNMVEDRALAFTNLKTTVGEVNEWYQIGAQFFSTQYTIPFDPNSKVQTQLTAFYSSGMDDYSTGDLVANVQEFPTIRAALSWTRTFESAVTARFLVKYRSSMRFEAFRSLNGIDLGLYQNISNQSLGRFSDTVDQNVMLNVYLTKEVGRSVPLQFFIDLNLPLLDPLQIHPIGAQEQLSLFTGIRLMY